MDLTHSIFRQLTGQTVCSWLVEQKPAAIQPTEEWFAHVWHRAIKYLKVYGALFRKVWQGLNFSNRFFLFFLFFCFLFLFVRFVWCHLLLLLSWACWVELVHFEIMLSPRWWGFLNLKLFKGCTYEGCGNIFNIWQNHWLWKNSDKTNLYFF